MANGNIGKELAAHNTEWIVIGASGGNRRFWGNSETIGDRGGLDYTTTLLHEDRWTRALWASQRGGA